MFFSIGTDMGIDLGTATVLVYVKGKGCSIERTISSSNR
jgi:rod shape-determining protein MreB and related proteins